MTVRYEHLLGRPFNHGVVDCYELLREFYRDNYAIELTSYARPDNWWEHGMNLYMENYPNEGFKAIDVQLHELQEGDLFLMAVNAEVANHVGIYIGNGEFIHHLYGKRSEKKRYHGLWRDMTVAVLRHKDVKPPVSNYQQYDLSQDLPHVFRR